MPLADGGQAAPVPARPKTRAKAPQTTDGSRPSIEDTIQNQVQVVLDPLDWLYGTGSGGVPNVQKKSKLFNPEAVLETGFVEDLPPATYTARGHLQKKSVPNSPTMLPGSGDSEQLLTLSESQGGFPTPVQIGPPSQAARRTGVQRRNGDPNQEIVDKPLLSEIGGRASAGVDAELLAKAKRKRINPVDTEVENARADYSEARSEWDEFGIEDVPGSDFIRGGWAGNVVNQKGNRIRATEKDLNRATRHERQRAINSKGDEKPIRKQVDRMTLAEYEALSPQEQAAVQFNSMLVNAVRRDRRLEPTYDATPDQKKAYKAEVQKIFGKHRGSKTYAPEVVSFLSQIGYQDSDADLDDFLNLNAAIRGNDLKNLATPTTPTAISRDERGDVESNRVALARDLSSAFRDTKQALVKDKIRLDTLDASFRAERAEHVDLLGGTDRPARAGEGLVEDVDGFFSRALEIISDPEADTDKTWDFIRQTLSEKQLRQFRTYAEQHAPREVGDGKKSA